MKIFIIAGMTRILKYLLFSGLIFMSFRSIGQEDSKAVTRRKEQLQKQEEKKTKLAEKGHEEGLENHMKIQTKETRKRMKKNKKKSKQYNNNRQDPFFVRWFSK